MSCPRAHLAERVVSPTCIVAHSEIQILPGNFAKLRNETHRGSWGFGQNPGTREESVG